MDLNGVARPSSCIGAPRLQDRLFYLDRREPFYSDKNEKHLRNPSICRYGGHRNAPLPSPVAACPGPSTGACCRPSASSPSPSPPPSPMPIDNHAARALSDELRTIFISGLPEDVKERELQNLLRWLPGYEASQVNFKGEHPMGFALFATPQHAHAAKDTLQIRCCWQRKSLLFCFSACNRLYGFFLGLAAFYDIHLESKSVLHTEMAKKNLFVKRGIVADSNSYDQSKRMRTGGDYTHTAYSTSPFNPPRQLYGDHMGTSGFETYMAPAPPPYDPYAGYAVPPSQCLLQLQLQLLYLHLVVMYLFSQPGFKQMKTIRQERHTVCFIEFEDVNSATNVHRSLQGAVIPSSVQLACNPFGKRKDFIHLAAASHVNGTPPPMTYH
ncbi:hypothetical protein DH2020_038155 [Rehmannia glutinosa]|uniref:RRM domain-containing protein n=1 Tax=Rehmannia glutinosa TaxID=99300 RepID=A0ABR0V0M7_REHGL